jgi:K+-transporting ATPase ATPase C chain
MRRDLTASLVAVLALTVLLGLAYPLAMTGIAQVFFPNGADGSRVERGGKLVGSSLIGQDFRKRVPNDRKKGPRYRRIADQRYFQSRPSATGYSADVTYFNNLGPNSKELRDQIRARVRAYLALEKPYDPCLSRAEVPVDAVTASGSGVDPQISEANAAIQAHRVAAVRGLPLERVQQLIDEHTAGRALGVLGEPGVNVLELNVALDEEGS